jgi:signal transduction histidine kinase
VARLLVLKGNDEGRQFELGDKVVGVGRDASNRIRLHDTEVSRRHAEFCPMDGGFQVHDLDSANGTFVNGQRIDRAELKPGDRVSIGQTIFVFSTDPRRPADVAGDLAQRISLIARGGGDLGSAIVKTIGEAEGGRILTQSNKASPWLQNQLAANLSILYETSQAVSHILDVPQLLQKLLELIFRSIPADRGIALLTVAKGDPQPAAIHWRLDGEHPDQFLLSRSIVDHVLRERQGVLLSDAARDERFNRGQSIVNLGIREVICVPMKGRHETLGVLYFDTQLSQRDLAEQPTTVPGKFNGDHLALAIAIGHQAALAVEETRYHQALVEAEKLAAVGQTIAALSHHIKNILQGLRSGTEILKMGIDQKNDRLVQQGWRVAEKNQGKIYDLVMDMLSYSKDRVPSVEPTDLNGMVDEIVELLTPRAVELGVTLEKSLTPNLAPVPVDPDGIHRALLNLVGNAIDAVESRPAPKVTVGTRTGDDGYVRIVVLDNGVGISPERIPEMFKIFVSTKGSRGTGLGLPVSQKILREHGGDLRVQSQVDVGSKFTMKLPLKSPLSLDLSSTSQDMPIMPPEEPV